MITEDYVSFECAKLLKEKGFDEKVNHVYHYYTSAPFYRRHLRDFNGEDYKNLKHEHYSAPTLQMAMKWLREEYNIDILITIGGFIEKGKVYFCSVYKNLINYGDLKECSTYEEACEAGIKHCLENII